ncbi:hypothetical protein HDG38_006721 [Paraburkholderia sp. WSM4177]|nr:hypothetical protein [Paraburkholderia sp. WSM4177]MBB5488489.1 hypothetical protein [Paraburkholderia sp. WSM4180]
MAQALGELAAQDSPAYKSASLVLAGLLKAEIAEREVRSLAYQMKAARFPAYRDIGGFDFSCSDANEALVRQLYECEFIDSAHNIVLVGGPGTGVCAFQELLIVELEWLRFRVTVIQTPLAVALWHVAFRLRPLVGYLYRAENRRDEPLQGFLSLLFGVAIRKDNAFTRLIAVPVFPMKN